MSTFTINLTDGRFIVSIPEKTMNSTATSILIPGRGYVNYGEVVAEDLVHMLENFCDYRSPKAPLEGQLWFNNWEKSGTSTLATENRLNIRVNQTWVPLGYLRSGAYSGTSVVDHVSHGELFFNPASGQLYAPDSRGGAPGSHKLHLIGPLGTYDNDTQMHRIVVTGTTSGGVTTTVEVLGSVSAGRLMSIYHSGTVTLEDITAIKDADDTSVVYDATAFQYAGQPDLLPGLSMNKDAALGQIIATNIMPVEHQSFDMGSWTRQWRNAYIQTVYATGSVQTPLVQSISPDVDLVVRSAKTDPDDLSYLRFGMTGTGESNEGGNANEGTLWVYNNFAPEVDAATAGDDTNGVSDLGFSSKRFRSAYIQTVYGVSSVQTPLVQSISPDVDLVIRSAKTDPDDLASLRFGMTSVGQSVEGGNDNEGTIWIWNNLAPEVDATSDTDDTNGVSQLGFAHRRFRGVQAWTVNTTVVQPLLDNSNNPMEVYIHNSRGTTFHGPLRASLRFGEAANGYFGGTFGQIQIVGGLIPEVDCPDQTNNGVTGVSWLGLPEKKFIGMHAWRYLGQSIIPLYHAKYLAITNAGGDTNTGDPDVDNFGQAGIKIRSTSPNGVAATTHGPFDAVQILGNLIPVTHDTGQVGTVEYVWHEAHINLGNFNGITVTNVAPVASGDQTITLDGGVGGGFFKGQWNLSPGTSLHATYADLAERYTPATGEVLEAGDVVKLGGDREITRTTAAQDPDVFGVISTNPALVLNSGSETLDASVALVGRVPVKAVGRVRKGQRLVSSDLPGVAMAAEGRPDLYAVIGRALADKDTDGIGLVEIVVGKN